MDYLAHGADNATSVETLAFKEGRPSNHELGVLYQAPWENLYDGFNEHSRRNALALHQTGLPVHLRSIAPQIQYPSELKEYNDMEMSMRPMTRESISRYSLQIHQVVPTTPMMQRLTFMPHLTEEENALVNRFKIVYIVFERDRLHPDMIKAISRAGQVWTACQLNADVLERCGVPKEKIRVVPMPYFETDVRLPLASRKRSDGPPRFYHIGKWEPRKAQDKIIQCFMRAFKPSEAMLYLKTSAFFSSTGGYYENANKVLEEALEDDEVISNGWRSGNVSDWIKIITKQLSTEQIVSIHKLCDVYVTLSRGEGFDMPAFDAKLSGNLMMYTPNGGPIDFSSPMDCLVPKSGMIACHPIYRWETDACYLDFEEEEAIAAYRKMATRALLWREGHYPHPMDQFRSDNVAQAMLKNMREILPEGGRLSME